MEILQASNLIIFTFQKISLYINSFAVISLSIFSINFVYRYIEINWPHNYFGPDDKYDIFLSIKPYHYFTFSLLPPLLIITVIQGIAYKAEFNLINPVLCGLITGIVYVSTTHLKAFCMLLTNNDNIHIYRNHAFQYVLHIVSIVNLIIIAILAGWLSSNKLIHFWLPEITNLIDNVWGAFFTALILYYIYKFYKRPKEILLGEIIEKGSKGIDKEIYRRIDKVSSDNNADSLLVKAVCIAESLERPKWFRLLEDFASKFKEYGTYGIMQVKSKKQLSDVDSVNRAINQYFKNTNTMTYKEKLLTIKRYNNNENYIKLVEEIMYFLYPIDYSDEK